MATLLAASAALIFAGWQLKNRDKAGADNLTPKRPNDLLLQSSVTSFAGAKARPAETPSPVELARPWGALWQPPYVEMAALGLIVLVNQQLNERRLIAAVLIALACGLAIWGLFVWDRFGKTQSRVTSDISSSVRPGLRRIQWVFLGIALVATGLAAYWSDHNQFTAQGVAAWTVAIVTWTVGWWPTKSDAQRNDKRAVPADSPSWGQSDWAQALYRKCTAPRFLAVVTTLLLVLAAGSFYRLYRISETPLDPTSDHAEKLLDVQDIRDGVRPIFFERNTGREPAQFYLTFGLIDGLGMPLDFTTLKVGTALVGLLAIPFVYLLAAEIGGQLTGVTAAALFSIGKWPVEISRAGLRFPYGLTWSAIVLWLTVRWMRTGNRRDALVCGLCIGGGLYGYTPFRVVVPAAALGFGIALLNPRRVISRRQVIGHAFLAATTAVIVFVPLGRYAVEHPDLFWYRASNRITGDENPGVINSFFDNLSTFLENNWNALLAFNWRGDSTFVNAVSFDPFLDVVTGGLFLAGLLVVIIRIIRSRDAVCLFAVLSLPVLMLSSTLALGFPWENPSVNRMGPAAPLIFAIAALPVSVLVEAIWADQRPNLRKLAVGSVAAVTAVGLCFAAAENYDRYFHDFDYQTRVNVVNTTEIADAIAGAEAIGIDKNDVYLVDREFWLDVRNVGIALGDITWGPRQQIAIGGTLPAQQPGRPLLLVLNKNDEARLGEVRRLYPSGILTVVPSEFPSHEFALYWVPPQPG
jgi:Dolichyl-phosphate-mannose-protein mannosyltransferase